MDFEKLKPFSMQAQSLQKGKYRHYKGDDYEVLFVGRHTETLEELVVYRALYGSYDVWIRPITLFFEDVEFKEAIVPRFERIGE